MMLLRRKIVLAAAMTLVTGPVGATIGYGVYLRSDLHRRAIQEELTRFLDLPTLIGRVVPESLTRWGFEGVEVWLPDRRDRVFSCRRAEWSERADDAGNFTELEIRGGQLAIGSEAWQFSDYRHVLESGLSHNFAALHLREVRLWDIDLAWVRRDLHLTVRHARGTVVFPRPDEGRATLLAPVLNGTVVSRPIHIDARFNPLGGLTLHEVTLDLPAVDITTLGIGSILGTPLTTGRFRGRITYRERDDETVVELSGEAKDVLLSEFTQRIAGGPFTGRMDLTLDDLRIVRGVPRRVTFRGHLRDIDLQPLAALWGQPQIEGRGDLVIESARIEDGRIDQLSLRGRVRGPSLEAITARIGHGTITGRLSLVVNALHVVDNEILAADVDVTAEPPDDGPGTIDRQFILETLKVVFGVDLGFLAKNLPERVEYTQFGAKLLVDDGTLRFLGTHGKNGETILTIRVFGREIGVIDQPATSIELKPFLDELERRAEDLNFDDLRRWWEQPSTAGSGERGTGERCEVRGEREPGTGSGGIEGKGLRDGGMFSGDP